MRVVLTPSPTSLDPIEVVVLETKVQGTALSVTFDESEHVDLKLKPGDVLRFELWDDNVTTADT